MNKALRNTYTDTHCPSVRIKTSNPRGRTSSDKMSINVILVTCIADKLEQISGKNCIFSSGPKSLNQSINQSINHKSLCSIATSRLKVLQEWCSLTVCREIRWWDLDTIGWRAMSWDADGMTSTTELTSCPLAGRSRCVEQQPRKHGYRR